MRLGNSKEVLVMEKSRTILNDFELQRKILEIKDKEVCVPMRTDSDATVK